MEWVPHIQRSYSEDGNCSPRYEELSSRLSLVVGDSVESALVCILQATHGIMADADYAPLHNFYDKNNLNIHASQQMFSLKSYGASRYRRLDWIYRLVPLIPT